MKAKLSELIKGVCAAGMIVTVWAPISMARADIQVQGDDSNRVSFSPAPNGDEFALRVENRSDTPLVLRIDLHCTRGPDYRQGVDRHSVREFAWSTNNSGSCLFERSDVHIGINEDITRTQFHWRSGFLTPGWLRGEPDGPLPLSVRFSSTEGGSSSLIFEPRRGEDPWDNGGPIQNEAE